MNTELSKRVGRIMNTITRLGGHKLKYKLIEEIEKADNFEDLKKETKRIIEMAEKIEGVKKK